LGRPAVSVVVPFRGSAADAKALLRRLRALRLGPRDELIVADNSDDACLAAILDARGPVRAVRAEGERSSYHARNAGAASAAGEWILFLDADCGPAADLLDAYFAVSPAERSGALAGQIDGDPAQSSLVARYTRSRNFFRQDVGFLAEAQTAATGNLLVRRSAFEEVGGFVEGIRSAGDVELCRRLVAAGWKLEARPQAVVHHRHRETLPSLLAAIARYGAGSRWLNERYPGTSSPWPLAAGLAGVARDVPRNLARGRLEEATFRLIDGLGLAAHVVGYRMSNAASQM
jgi:GT2 family glycosyltransferase